MIENHRIKRGLLRLGEATVSELSSFAACERTAVVEFLERSPDIVERVASERWHLLSQGRERLRSELVGLRGMSTPDLEAEREQVYRRLRGSIRQILATLTALERRFDPDNEEDVFACKGLLRRIGATRRSARKLDAALDGFDLEVSFLDEAEKRLERLVAAAGTGDAGPSGDPIADCLSAWAIGCAAAFGEAATALDRFVPLKAEAGAVVIVDGDASLHWMTETMVEAARSANAPVMRLTLNLGDKSVRTSLLERLSGQVATAAGAAARVVFTIDSRRPEWLDFADELRKFEHDRSRLRRAPDSENYAWRVLGDASMRRHVHVLREHFGDARQEVDTVERYLVGALVSHMADDFRNEHPRASGGEHHRWPHLRTICIDAANPTPPLRHLEASDVVVFGLDQLRRLPNHGVSVFEPLPLTHRAVPSPSQQAWRAVFVPAVERGDE